LNFATVASSLSRRAETTMSSIDRRRVLSCLMLALTGSLVPGCFSGPAGPEAPNKPANPEPPPKVEIPTGKNALPKQAIGHPID
jgi:hypothetical protein